MVFLDWHGRLPPGHKQESHINGFFDVATSWVSHVAIKVRKRDECTIKDAVKTFSFIVTSSFMVHSSLLHTFMVSGYQ
jgi:hypothetical protein